MGKTLATMGAHPSQVESAVALELARGGAVNPVAWRKVEGGVAVDAPIFRYNSAGVFEIVAGRESVLAMLQAHPELSQVPGLLV